MNKQKQAGTNLKLLIELLANEDGVIRLRARKSLVTLGKPAVSSLIRTLQNSRLDHVRWEAAKTLGEIGDTRAVPSLVEALEDSDDGVAWLAAEALRKFKKVAWPKLLRRLIKRGSESFLLRQRAHHVLWNQKEVGFNDLIANLRKTLESSTASESISLAATEILNRMKAKS